jgi:hypothetical protein
MADTVQHRQPHVGDHKPPEAVGRQFGPQNLTLVYAAGWLPHPCWLPWIPQTPLRLLASHDIHHTCTWNHPPNLYASDEEEIAGLISWKSTCLLGLVPFGNWTTWRIDTNRNEAPQGAHCDTLIHPVLNLTSMMWNVSRLRFASNWAWYSEGKALVCQCKQSENRADYCWRGLLPTKPNKTRSTSRATHPKDTLYYII